MLLEMSKKQVQRCFWVSFAMALVIPILLEEIYVSVHEVRDRPDYAEYAKRLKQGDSIDEAAFWATRRIEGWERISYRFESWLNFRDYLASAARMFVILLAATLLATTGRAREESTT